MSADDDRPTFETVDWDAYDDARPSVAPTTAAFVASLLALAGLFAYDYLFVPSAHTLVAGFSPAPLDWLSLFSVVLLLFYVVVPLARDRELTVRYWRRFRRDPVAVAGLAYLGLFVLGALLGPELWGDPVRAPKGTEVATRGGTPVGLPPFWGAIDADVPLYCGTEVVDGMCQGTTVHPLGTTPEGKDVLALVFEGMNKALKIGVITAAIIVPIATAVGTAAAAYGGRVEGALMRYVDLQQAIPGFIAYLLVEYLYGPSLLAVVLLFGLLDWGRIARRVRGDAIRFRDAGFVRAARDAGAGRLHVVRRHMVPNVANTVVAGLAVQLPFIIVMEATLAYIGVSTPEGWGWSIKIGLEAGSKFTDVGAGWAWWAYAFPILALLLTVVATSVVGDAVHDAIEPREGGGSR